MHILRLCMKKVWTIIQAFELNFLEELRFFFLVHKSKMASIQNKICVKLKNVYYEIIAIIELFENDVAIS